VVIDRAALSSCLRLRASEGSVQSPTHPKAPTLDT
jgi:hypothetical protein